MVNTMGPKASFCPGCRLLSATAQLMILPFSSFIPDLALLHHSTTLSSNIEKSLRQGPNIGLKFFLTGKKPLFITFDRSSRRKRGMASNPLFIIPDFLHFPNKLSYGYLRFEGIFPFSSNLRQPQLSSFGKCKEKPGIPFWGWTPCLFPSKTCC